MRHNFSPRALNLPAFAQEGASLSGTESLQNYERLSEESQRPDADFRVKWAARGELRPQPGGQPAVWLHLAAEATVGMTCQRCLTPVPVPVATERWFRFVADEALAEAQDNDAEEDVLALSTRFDLLELVEDELLMELPLVPRHDTCPVEVPGLLDEGTTDAGADPATEARPNPFAALESLRGKKLN